MAMSTCIKCGGHLFEVKENEPHDSRFKVLFVQCRTCGGVIGAMDHYNIGALIHSLAKKLGFSNI